MAFPPAERRPARPDLAAVDALTQLAFVVIDALEKRASDQDLSVVQTRLLGMLRDRRPTMNELAKLLDLDKSSVTGLVDRAERRGLVSRLPSDTDRRSVTVALTAHGRRLTTDVAARFAADIDALLDQLPTADRARFTDLASHVLCAHAQTHGIDPVAGLESAHGG